MDATFIGLPMVTCERKEHITPLLCNSSWGYKLLDTAMTANDNAQSFTNITRPPISQNCTCRRIYYVNFSLSSIGVAGQTPSGTFCGICVFTSLSVCAVCASVCAYTHVCVRACVHICAPAGTHVTSPNTTPGNYFFQGQGGYIWGLWPRNFGYFLRICAKKNTAKKKEKIFFTPYA